MLDFGVLDRVVKETLAAIEKSKIEIYEIVEGTADEIQRVRAELATVQAEATAVIVQVDEQTQRLKAARRRLVLVSRNFTTYNESDIKEAYEAAEKETSSSYSSGKRRGIYVFAGTIWSGSCVIWRK